MHFNKQSGFTIVEIMISMLLGLIMMVGVVSLVIGNKRSFQEQNETSRIQENARFAIQILIEDIRMAGYVGCQPANDATVSPTVNNNLSGLSAGDLLSMTDPVEGVESATGTWGNSTNTEMVGNMVAGSDGITVRYFVPAAAGITTTGDAAAGSVAVDGVAGLSANTIAAIADCNQAEVFKVTGAAGTTVSYAAGTASPLTAPGNADNEFTGDYPAGAEILGFKAVRYFIGADTTGDGALNTTAQITAADPTTYTPSLYRYIYEGGSYQTQELISGVESMQILYGEDRAAGPVFVSANNVTDWADVHSVKIALLLRSEDEVGTDTDVKDIGTGTSDYDLLGTGTIALPDLNVRRRVFNASAQLRNRT